MVASVASVASGLVQVVLIVLGLLVLWRLARMSHDAEDGRSSRAWEARRNFGLVAGGFVVCFGVFNFVAVVDLSGDHAPPVRSDCPVEWSPGPFGPVCIERTAP